MKIGIPQRLQHCCQDELNNFRPETSNFEKPASGRTRRLVSSAAAHRGRVLKFATIKIPQLTQILAAMLLALLLTAATPAIATLSVTTSVAGFLSPNPNISYICTDYIELTTTVNDDDGTGGSFEQFLPAGCTAILISATGPNALGVPFPPGTVNNTITYEFVQRTAGTYTYVFRLKIPCDVTPVHTALGDLLSFTYMAGVQTLLTIPANYSFQVIKSEMVINNRLDHNDILQVPQRNFIDPILVSPDQHRKFDITVAAGYVAGFTLRYTPASEIQINSLVLKSIPIIGGTAGTLQLLPGD